MKADVLIIRVIGKIADEGAVDLQPGDGKALERAQALTAGAQIIDGEIHAERLQLLHHGYGLVGGRGKSATSNCSFQQ